MLSVNAVTRPSRIASLLMLAFALSPVRAQSSDSGRPTDRGVAFHKISLTDHFFSEGAAFGDFNHDGRMDAVAGPYWFEGPDFTHRHELYPAASFDPLQYSDNFLTFVHDFNADGWPDVLVIGFPGKDASWWENPRSNDGKWVRHLVFDGVDCESPTFVDLLGDHQPVLVCMNGGHIGYATPNLRDPTQPWTFHAITPPGSWQRYTHGLGVGDVNGDGRADVVEKDGWWEQPASLTGDPIWKKHPANFGEGGAQMYTYDVNGDGRADIITCRKAHGYGLSWFEQLPDSDGTAFREHAITSGDPNEKIAGIQFSQPHAIILADVDGDGLPDIITGKRWWAHGPDHDPEPNATPVLYAFLLRRAPNNTAMYEPHLIDDASGVGTEIAPTDVNGDGRADIITANKRGAFVFLSASSK